MRKMEAVIPLKEEVYKVTGCAMTVLNTLGHGFAEKIYENALSVELGLQNISYKAQHEIDVEYKGVNVGRYIPDFIIDDCLIVELKTIDKIGNNEKAQVLNYLKATGFEVGLIINFKNAKLEWQRVVLSR